VRPEPGEEIFFHGHPSWRSILSFYIKGIALAIAGGIIAGIVTAIASSHVQSGWIVAAVLLVIVLTVLVGLFRRLSTTYSITNQRLTIEHGIISHELHETRLERVQNVSSRQSGLERLLRVGTVDFDTAASGNFDFSFRGVNKPRAIVRTVDRAIHQHRADAAGAGP
jgi:uncharacterized membrane protein YdbT with pleckstrin-like domain